MPKIILNSSFSEEHHIECAKIFKTVQDELKRLSEIVHRAPYTDAVLQSLRVIQEKLVDPLADDYERKHPISDSKYIRVGYGASWPRRSK